VNAAGQGSQQTDMKPTIVLVHGAFADASSWNGVIERLQQQGYTVIAPANPPAPTSSGRMPSGRAPTSSRSRART
jgi:alpha-beta hydrolase superfamily lysophospholipase